MFRVLIVTSSGASDIMSEPQGGLRAGGARGRFSHHPGLIELCTKNCTNVSRDKIKNETTIKNKILSEVHPQEVTLALSPLWDYGCVSIQSVRLRVCVIFKYNFYICGVGQQ